ncbi:hypothetical protein QN277_010431 [Acacia crassicarpa]|uniref:Lipoxygenase domain-containing protein n=1 Tax=Acacia crassicarpa TaxID=499986 RepID=A0AAE1INS6_9FABA|nr:hypothetical protein QN277_010431 [Acacia crassicarpa]
MKPLLESAFNFTSNEFNSFDEARELYEGGFQLPQDARKNISEKMPIPMLKELFRTDGEQALSRYPTPKVIKGNKFGRMTDEEFAREMLASVNPAIIWPLQGQLTQLKILI